MSSVAFSEEDLTRQSGYCRLRQYPLPVYGLLPTLSAIPLDPPRQSDTLLELRRKSLSQPACSTLYHPVACEPDTSRIYRDQNLAVSGCFTCCNPTLLTDPIFVAAEQIGVCRRQIRRKPPRKVFERNRVLLDSELVDRIRSSPLPVTISAVFESWIRIIGHPPVWVE